MVVIGGTDHQNEIPAEEQKPLYSQDILFHVLVKTQDRSPWLVCGTQLVTRTRLLLVQVALTPGLHLGPGIYTRPGFYSRFYSILVEKKQLLNLTFTFTFGEDSMLSSAEAVMRFGPMHNPEITERLCKSL